MAQRRMFSLKIVDSAKFLKMPTSSQNLYFHLGMRADDDGIVEGYNVMRMTGTTEDDLKILVLKDFVTILNEDLVSFINDWNEHNLIRADRKIDSIYKDLLLQIMPDVRVVKKKQRADVKSSAELLGEQITNNQQSNDGQTMDGQWTDIGQSNVSIGKDRLGKDSIGKNSINTICPELENKQPKKRAKKAINETDKQCISEKPETVFELPLNDNSLYAINSTQINEWSELYPSVDVMQCLRNMKGWLISNPDRKKTKRGILRFITTWLSKEQDRGGVLKKNVEPAKGKYSDVVKNLIEESRNK